MTLFEKIWIKTAISHQKKKDSMTCCIWRDDGRNTVNG